MKYYRQQALLSVVNGRLYHKGKPVDILPSEEAELRENRNQDEGIVSILPNRDLPLYKKISWPENTE